MAERRSPETTIYAHALSIVLSTLRKFNHFKRHFSMHIDNDRQQRILLLLNLDANQAEIADVVKWPAS